MQLSIIVCLLYYNNIFQAYMTVVGLRRFKKFSKLQVGNRIYSSHYLRYSSGMSKHVVKLALGNVPGLHGSHSFGVGR